MTGWRLDVDVGKFNEWRRQRVQWILFALWRVPAAAQLMSHRPHPSDVYGSRVVPCRAGRADAAEIFDTPLPTVRNHLLAERRRHGR